MVLPVAHGAHLDPDRPAGQHLTWGLGPHRCLGEHVAQIAIEETINALLSLPRLELREIPQAWPEATMPSPPCIVAAT